MKIKLSIAMLLELGTDKEAQQLQKDGGNQSGITKGEGGGGYATI